MYRVLFVISLWICVACQDSQRSSGEIVLGERDAEKINHQPDKHDTLSKIYGKWVCVASDYRGFQKFSIGQAKLLESSILNIDEHQTYYEHVNFLDTCKYQTLKLKKDLQYKEFDGTSFSYRYNQEELSNMIRLEPVHIDGEWSCFNDCAHLFLKGDTLINICGGYTLFFLKKKVFD